jgi:hypothetical protein
MQLQQPWFVQDLDLEAQQQWDSCAVRTCCWRFLLFLAIFVHPDHTHSSSMTNTREGTYHHRHHHHHPCEEMRIWDYRSFLQRWWVESVFKQIQSYSAAIAFPSEESWGFRVNFCCFSTHKILLRQYLLFMRASITGNLSFLLPFLQHIFRAFVNFMLVILFEFHSLFSLQNIRLRRIWKHNFMDSITDLKAMITFMCWWSVKMLENCRKHEKWDM